MADLEAPDRLITITRAAEIAGLSDATLLDAAKQNRLQATRLGQHWVTSRRHLHVYLVGRRGKSAQHLPEGYQVPDARDTAD